MTYSGLRFQNRKQVLDVFSPMNVFLKLVPSHLTLTPPSPQKQGGAGGSEVLGPDAKITCHHISL